MQIFGEAAMASVAECHGVMAAITLLRVALRLDRVNGNKVTAMAFWCVIALEGVPCQINTGTTALVAIKAPLLLMALTAIVAGLAGQDPVAADEIRIMVDCNAFRLMAGVALPDRHVFIFGMIGLLFGIGLLLEADKSKTKNCKNKSYFFHPCLLS